MQELAKARKQFVLENELHIIYLIVPIYAAVSWPKLDWMNFLRLNRIFIIINIINRIHRTLVAVSDVNYCNIRQTKRQSDTTLEYFK